MYWSGNQIRMGNLLRRILFKKVLERSGRSEKMIEVLCVYAGGSTAETGVIELFVV